jgi:hypothetical protein
MTLPIEEVFPKKGNVSQGITGLIPVVPGIHTNKEALTNITSKIKHTYIPQHW